MEFKPITASDIEVRVGQCKENGCSLLLYKDARVDMRVLDEAVGAEGWQCRYYEHKGTLFCSIGIKFDGEWVWKDNAGTPSNMEAQKGEASDAFKRAGFVWGIGRELYTAPFIWVTSDNCNIKTGKNGKPQCYDRFTVPFFEVAEGRIIGLEVYNDTKGRVVFSMNAPRKQVKRDAAYNEAVTDFINALGKYCDKHGADLEEMKVGIKKRPDFKNTTEYYRKLAKEFSK